MSEFSLSHKHALAYPIDWNKSVFVVDCGNDILYIQYLTPALIPNRTMLDFIVELFTVHQCNLHNSKKFSYSLYNTEEQSSMEAGDYIDI